MARSESKKDNTKKNQDSLIDPIYTKFVRGVVRAIGSTAFYEYFMDALSRADNEFQFSNRRMIKVIDLSWVDAVEASLEALQNIIGSPRNVIREEEFIVNVENAKKGGPEVVRHLATHAPLVDDYNENEGDVRPGRLMQRYREDSIGTYENRLVFTAMEYAYRFVKLRHDAIFDAMSDEFGAKLKVRSDMTSSIEKVHMDLFLHIKDIDSALTTDDKNSETFARISRLYRLLGVYMNSSFAEQMGRLPRIKGQINKTNLLKKHKDYKKIVALYEFLRNYDDVGYSIKVAEQNPRISEEFRDDIYRNILFNYLILNAYLENASQRQITTEERSRKRVLKPKVVREIIEEITENYDLPDVEARKVLIEELTKADLMREEADERRRLVAEREERKKAEAEKKRQEKEAEKERVRREKQEAKERARLEKLAAEEKLRQEKALREIEQRRRTALFTSELKRFADGLEEQLALRAEELERRQEGLSDYADAAEILEKTERMRAEERELLRKRKKAQEEQEAFRKEEAEAETPGTEAYEARVKAEREAEAREAELRERIEAEARRAEEEKRLAEEERKKKEALEAMKELLRREEEKRRAEEEKRLAEEEEARKVARDRAALALVSRELMNWNSSLVECLKARATAEEAWQRGKREHEEKLRHRAS
ncbi:MAG: hypothetical protein ILP01_02820 [Clostridia bacterium]|nr:hypothetical protein [Clostridia bacterium]